MHHSNESRCISFSLTAVVTKALAAAEAAAVIVVGEVTNNKVVVLAVLANIKTV